ncbi:DUF58 domain-containing protein [Parvularcula dongshanensis]|uniref:Uncharacterized protein (DUF58 family) n=1 Tax=Parvularcula dongshanensis TaxID=1173995 RepID=A0A840HZM3_9PROT|nr:DUF58 domain-containing protein [Parvularcula dongshanensis]MBB4657867.1 uncharacterized protein (DUF58 family) [Parvularcula dongshanensis]
MATPVRTPATLERSAGSAASSLPALLTEAERVAGTLAAGLHGRRRPGTGETFWQYRDYAQGDAASAVDWRQSARSPGRLFVRQTEWETAATVRLWVPGTESLDYASGEVTKGWRAAVIAVGLAVLLGRGGERTGSMDGPARSGRIAAAALAERLLAADTDPLPPLPPEGATRLVYVSDFHADTDQLLARLAAIRAAGRPCHLVQVSDPAEVTFPFEGRTVFRSPSGRERMIFGDAGAVRTGYAAAREAHLGALKDACARYGWTYTAHATDKPATPVLAALHAAMSQDRAR